MNRDSDREKLLTLRKRAQDLLNTSQTHTHTMSQEEIKKLTHELETYQLELELQNEDLRGALEALEESRARYTDLYDFAPVGYLTVNGEGLIIEANLTAADMLGVARGHLIKEPLSNFIINDDQDIFYRHRKLLIESHTRQTCALQMRNNGLSRFYVQLESIVRPEIDGSEGQFRTIITDVSERVAARQEIFGLESELRQAHKMEAIGTMAGGIAHDFNNMLAVILGYAELIEENLPQYDPQREHILKVLKAGNQASDLVKQILAFSSNSGPVKGYGHISLNPIVKEILQLQQSVIPENITLKTDIDENCGLIKGDPVQIHQVLMNFFTNAIHAMEEKGGILAVDLHKAKISTKDVITEPDLRTGTYLRLSVSDTGPGMTAETIDKIFDPYFTTKNFGKGSGMGLSVVHGIVRSHKGFINVDSKPGRGSIFNAYFPWIEEKIDVKETPAYEKIPIGTEKVLFIDDREMLTDIGKTMLENLGYSVTAINDSSEALDLFVNNPNQFDLVITDQTMPNLTGSELAQQFLQIRSDIPIILCTGYSVFIDKIKAQEIGIKAFVMKPIHIRDLSRLIRKVLDGDKL
jgi:PAS domain S-box-containing protein